MSDNSRPDLCNVCGTHCTCVLGGVDLAWMKDSVDHFITMVTLITWLLICFMAHLSLAPSDMYHCMSSSTHRMCFCGPGLLLSCL